MLIIYRDYEIKEKLDFGSNPHIIKGEVVKEGVVVVKDGCNAMPGATWFRNIIDAKEAIDALILADGNSEVFWLIMRRGGGNTVSTGENTGRVRVPPCIHTVTFSRTQNSAYPGSVEVAGLGSMTAVEALALAASIRRAALYSLGDSTCNVR